ncbi:hypothetical protein DSAG12_00426 [Promethearchaeum syntrophicum]|uniref:Uncharacterized protein n=1 Tax=Promethearchaeum syntrophicum TaxID=2594042 RepID=A0A5B9D6L8_9ARCH|nr:hypothetical protein [Candidatus Prometheoarchaeum syntrophicum]
MAEINFATRKYYTTVVLLLFMINLTIVISSSGDTGIFMALIFISIIPSICFVLNYLSPSSRNQKKLSQDEEN